MSIVMPENLLAEGSWQVDPVHSNVGFAVKHMVVSTFRGRFESFDVRVEESGGASRLTGTVDVQSIEVKDPDLAAHLQSPEFFDSALHPQLRFASTAVRRFGERVEVDGDLTVKGITRPVTGHGTITGPAADPYGSERLGLELEAVIDRRQYGLEWNMPLPKGGFALGNDVRLILDLELTKVG